ncbi:MAG: phosphate ABC transporter permease PstA [Pseudomonadota bacterium]
MSGRAEAHPLSRASVKRDHLVRRRAVNRIMETLSTLAAFTAVGILGIVVWSVASRGIDAIDTSFFTEVPAPFSFVPVETGIANAFVGSIILVALAAVMALPFGVMTAIYLSEYAGRRSASAIALSLDILNGIPSIVIGIFVFGLLVVGRGQSGVAGSFALAIIMVPLVARATQEVLRLVPDATREAALALGATKARTTLSVVLPQTIGGILTGGTLAVARVAGETAPLLFTSSIAGTAINEDPHDALASIPVTIFTFSESPNPADHAQAWAAALSLILFVLVLSLGSRALASRYRKKLGLTR